jgi:tRNA(adenine34) deaminase
MFSPARSPAVMIDRERQQSLMAAALAEARRGAAEGEVPVGAVVVADRGAGAILAAAHNQPIALSDPTAHAEILAMRAAAAARGAYRLDDAALFVTLEPCVMCVGALVNARVAALYFGARDEKAGALGSVYDIGRDGRLNHRIEVYAGVAESECGALLRQFFRARR